MRDRLPQTVEEANTDYDKILAEVNAMKRGTKQTSGNQLSRSLQDLR